jgi:hypothetical protein
MDQRERQNDPEVALRAALQGWQRKIWTALPGIVQGPVAADGTISVQPALTAKQRLPSGVIKNVTMPQLIKCPVVFPAGGGFVLTFPVGAGDEALMIFASRCIDSWWQSGGVQGQIVMRLHDLSDGFALVGPFSVPRAPAAISSNSVQLRSTDGLTYLEVAAGGVINAVAPGGIHVTGDITATGTITAGSWHHIHPTPLGDSGAPTTGTY